MQTLIESQPAQDAVPSDLTEWIEKWALASLILDAVQTVDWPESDFKLAASSGYSFRPLVMLTVVTYCYATGVYPSKGVESRICQDEVLRYVCRGTFPSWRDIRQFRRANRRLIRQSLVHAFKAAHQFRSRLAAVNRSRPDRNRVPRSDVPVEFNRLLQLVEAVETRLEQAEDFDIAAREE